LKLLFIHQNFPAQFKHVVEALAESSDNDIVAVTDERNKNDHHSLIKNLKVVYYKSQIRVHPATHHYIRDFEGHIQRGQQVLLVCQTLAREGFNPDVVVAHPAWGEALFLKDIFPNSRHLYYFEYFY